MDPKWLDREGVDQAMTAIDFRELVFDNDLGVYCHGGEPFTGLSFRRSADGRLQSIVHYAEGLATGVTVVWYPGGQIKSYSEMHSDTLHGLHIEWAKDGAKTIEQRYRRGKLLPA